MAEKEILQFSINVILNLSLPKESAGGHPEQHGWDPYFSECLACVTTLKTSKHIRIVYL